MRWMGLHAILPPALAFLVSGALLAVSYWLRRAWRREAAEQGEDQPRVLHHTARDSFRTALFIPLLVLGIGSGLFGLAIVPKMIREYRGAQALYSLELRCTATEVVLRNPLQRSFIARVDAIDIPTGLDSVCPVDDFHGGVEHRFEANEALTIRFRWPTWTESVREVKTLKVHLWILDDEDEQGRPLVVGERRPSTPVIFGASRTCQVQDSAAP